MSHEKKLPLENDIEKYAQDNLNIHKKGIFRKKFSVRDMLSWSKVRQSSVGFFQNHGLFYSNVIFRFLSLMFTYTYGVTFWNFGRRVRESWFSYREK
jgi:hypothetical protein